MMLYRTRFGLRSLVGLVGLAALLSWAVKVSIDARPANLYSKWLAEADVVTRATAAQELAGREADPAVAVPALIRALGIDPSAEVRVRSIRSLAEVLARSPDGPMLEAATGPLAAALADPDRAVRRAAADALGRVGPAPESALPALLRACGDADEWARGAAIGAIGLIQKKAKVDRPDARRAIAEALADPTEHVRAMGAYAFLATAEEAPDFPAAMLEREGPKARRGALESLARDASLAVRVVLELTRALADPDPAIRAGAARPFYWIRPLPGPTVEALRRALGDPDPAVRDAADSALRGEPRSEH